MREFLKKMINITVGAVRTKAFWSRAVNGVFVFGIFGFMLFGFGKAYLRPIETNEYENRTATKMPVPALDSFFAGEFQDGVESALSDQAVGAIPMKELYNTLSNKLQLAGVDFLVKNGGEGQFIGYNSLIYNDGYLLEPMIPLEDVKEGLDTSLDRIISAVDDLDVPTYLYYVGRDMDTDFSQDKDSGVYEYILQRLEGSGIDAMGRFHVGSIAEYRENFYMTDHHYNHVGAHRAYTELLAMLLPEEEPINHGEAVKLNYAFNGSRSRTAGSLGLVSEQIYAYDYPLPKVSVTVNKNDPTSVYGNRQRYVSGVQSEKTVADYAHMYGYDYGRVLFENGEQNNGEHLLILGDSYDNAYLWQLSSHFESVHAVDLRSYEESMGEAFHLSDYVEKNGITRVVFAGRNQLFYETMNALEG